MANRRVKKAAQLYPSISISHYEKVYLQMQDTIKLRSLRTSDAPTLFLIYSNAEAMKYRGSKVMTSIADAEAMIDDQEKREGSKLTLRMGIELINTKELIGSVMLRYDDLQIGCCEIGYSIGRQYWGKALGRTTVGLILKELQAKKEVNKVHAWTHPDNIASIKILERFDFCTVSQASQPQHLLFEKRLNW